MVPLDFPCERPRSKVLRCRVVRVYYNIVLFRENGSKPSTISVTRRRGRAPKCNGVGGTNAVRLREYVHFQTHHYISSLCYIRRGKSAIRT